MMNRLLEKSCGMLPRSPFAALELRGTLVVLHLKLYASYVCNSSRACLVLHP